MTYTGLFQHGTSKQYAPRDTTLGNIDALGKGKADPHMGEATSALALHSPNIAGCWLRSSLAENPEWILPGTANFAQDGCSSDAITSHKL